MSRSFSVRMVGGFRGLDLSSRVLLSGTSKVLLVGMKKRPRGLAGTALVWNGLGLEEQPGGDLELTRSVEAVVGSGGGAEG